MTARALIKAGGLLDPEPEDCPGAVPLAAARWTDRQKLAALLQGSALLAHLERAGRHLAAGFCHARAAPDGRLVIAGSAGIAGGQGIAAGRSPGPAQELLRDLLGMLFGSAVAIPGRGEARKAARALLDAWRQPLVPLSPDLAVAQVLEAAPFLWEPAFGPARSTLAAEDRDHGGKPRVWVAGPGPARARFLTLARDAEELRALLASPRARSLWEGEGPAPVTAEGRLAAAASLYGRGRFVRAKAALAGLRSPAAAVLRLRCLQQLGELGAVRAGLRRLAAAPLSPAEILEAAEVAVRVFGNSGGPGGPGQAGSWVERALAATGDAGPLHLRAHVLAAGAAWDRHDPSALAAHLSASRLALSDPGLAWRWHQARGLEALAAGESDAVLASLVRALRGSRRQLSRHEAAGLWSDLGIGRSGVGDLGGAERAFRHAARLFGGCDGPRRTTLALSNLAEIRLRRGELSGLREILEQSTAENRLAGNLRGLTHDLELWARLELVLGRPGAALTFCREALRQLDASKLNWRRDTLHTLAARALGWLGRSEEAAALLSLTTPAGRAELEAEERPALWAHAGDREAALREAAGTPLAGLWRAALTGERPPPAVWEALAGIEPYRAARLVFDLESVAPGTVPAEWRRAAVAVLRRTGSGLLAERLEAGEEGPWRALAAYLEKPLPPEDIALAALFREAGHPEATILLHTGAGERVLLAGPGGDAELAVETEDGRLVLRAPVVDAALAALFALFRRHWREGRKERAPVESTGATPPAGAAPSSPPSPPSQPSPPSRAPRAGGLVGESPALLGALERLARLAPRDLTVLILGETGTGKELAARYVHRASPRAAGPFVAVNCAALGESLLLSDLFGHVRGAFTGADKERAGVFETAQRGTVFLDEIGDLPAVAQGMLLRVLQEREVRRVGESLPRRVDVRVVAATHRDLASAVAAGTFREDLFYRLKVGSVELPPLRERGEDVLRLAEHCLARQCGPGFVPTLSRTARELLLAHPFPGNVRELENVLAVAAALAGGGTIEPEHLGLPEPVESAIHAGEDGSYHRKIEDFKRQLLIEELAACRGNQAEAARRLGLSRQGFSYLARQFRLP
jgi:transcriptional regulator with AAA-type ATPase domain